LLFLCCGVAVVIEEAVSRGGRCAVHAREHRARIGAVKYWITSDWIMSD